MSQVKVSLWSVGCCQLWPLDLGLKHSCVRADLWGELCVGQAMSLTCRVQWRSWDWPANVYTCFISTCLCVFVCAHTFMCTCVHACASVLQHGGEMYLEMGCSTLCFKKCDSELVVTSLLFSLRKSHQERKWHFPFMEKEQIFSSLWWQPGHKLNVLKDELASKHFQIYSEEFYLFEMFVVET